MTNAGQPEDTEVRFDNIDTRLEEIGDELDLLRTVQNANRRETRGNSQTIARLERSIRELGDIARLHQEGLRIAQREAERDRQAIREVELQADRDREVLLASLLQAERDRQTFQEEIRRIWEYLRDRNGGSSTPN
ncbi:hypothetical protein [Nostoc sp. CHAB 5715]|uniref:hypothetical protein n=1 Tax=Nostoc sp. CHAB 5715 TaxID=2780400 RepID=UPI001E63069A|nr:hypothetical protein [Nostoc sp. CHAB 5715]MCC5622829.1 hypothetical protein [Nostoc sp. CHAB 5715]